MVISVLSLIPTKTIVKEIKSIITTQMYRNSPRKREGFQQQMRHVSRVPGLVTASGQDNANI